MAEREDSPPRLVIEETLPYRWNPVDGLTINPDHPRAAEAYARRWERISAALISDQSWSVVLEAEEKPEDKWHKIVKRLFAVRQLQQWYWATGTALQNTNPALRDQVSKILGR